MESRPVIADEQSLERLEDEEEQDEEEDLDDDAVDEIDDELDILGEDDLVEDDDEESGEIEEEEGEAVAVEDEDDTGDVVEDSDSTSLEELLARRTASRSVSDDPDEDEDEDLLALSSEARRKASPPKSKVTPIRNREEFVCKRCFLLKPKVQLADAERMLCRDCV